MKRTILLLSLFAGFPTGSPGSAHAERRDRTSVPDGAALEASIVHLPRKSLQATESAHAAPAPERLVSIGFAHSSRLRAAVRDRLLQLGNVLIDPSQQVPAAPSGLFVGGQLMEMKQLHGWVDCRVSYLVARQPGPAVRIVDSAAASQPILPGRTAAERARALDIAEAGCLSEVAARIAESISQVGG